jgi:hypothetical protein
MLSEFMCNSRIEAPEPVWELRARSYRVITNTEVVRSCHAELVMLVGLCSPKIWQGPIPTGPSPSGVRERLPKG